MPNITSLAQALAARSSVRLLHDNVRRTQSNAENDERQTAHCGWCRHLRTTSKEDKWIITEAIFRRKTLFWCQTHEWKNESLVCAIPAIRFYSILFFHRHHHAGPLLLLQLLLFSLAHSVCCSAFVPSERGYAISLSTHPNGRTKERRKHKKWGNKRTTVISQMNKQ